MQTTDAPLSGTETAPPAAPTEAVQVPVVPTSKPPSEEDPFSPDPLDRILDLRSVAFTLTTQRPDGSIRTITGQIDEYGSLHITINEPAYDISGMPAGLERPAENPVVEFYVLNDHVYIPDAVEENWKTVSIDSNCRTSFSRELHGMESPALWLDLLPAGSVTPASSEDSGGFHAQCYAVSGQISDQTVTGKFCKDPQTNTLLAAELHVPAALLSTPDDPQSGEMVITLKVEKMEVPPITLP